MKKALLPVFSLFSIYAIAQILAGQKLQDFKLTTRTTAIDLRNYPSGVYILQFVVNNQTHAIKVLKK